MKTSDLGLRLKIDREARTEMIECEHCLVLQVTIEFYWCSEIHRFKFPKNLVLVLHERHEVG